MRISDMRAIDFCCGAGGLTRGLLDAGVKVLAGIDADVACRITYENNNRPAVFLYKDIRGIAPAEIWEVLGSRRSRDVLFACCAPCQPFSKQRKSQIRGCEATLLGAFGRLVASVKPGQVLIENVPGLAKVKGFSTYRRFLALLEECGYNYVTRVVNAKHYGVPQNRPRLVLIAMRGINPTIPERVCGRGLLPFATVREAIAHLPPIEAGQSHPHIPNHVAVSVSPLNLERLKHTPHDGGDRRTWPRRLWLDCHRNGYHGHSDVYGRMAWDAPSPALTGRCRSISNGRYGHPEQDRAISLREAAALQTFDDDYVFYGSKGHIALQIGNAVPIRLAEMLGHHLEVLRNGKGCARRNDSIRRGS